MAPGGPDPRSEARQEALELLYEVESKSTRVADILGERLIPPSEGARILLAGVENHRPRLDELIARYSTGWTIERMPVVDRCILRLATYELGEKPEVPTAVVLDEAVELAKRFSTEESGRFVNGVLSSIAKELRPAQ